MVRWYFHCFICFTKPRCHFCAVNPIELVTHTHIPAKLRIIRIALNSEFRITKRLVWPPGAVTLRRLAECSRYVNAEGKASSCLGFRVSLFCFRHCETFENFLLTTFDLLTNVNPAAKTEKFMRQLTLSNAASFVIYIIANN
jgi:hypothetical protein